MRPSHILQLPLALLCSSIVLAATAALPVETPAPAPELQQLSADNFTTATQHGVWFIEFFSPWCAHCRSFAPTWERLVAHVAAQSPPPAIELAQVNCLAHGDLCSTQNVRGYPSLKLYEDGKATGEFTGDREFDLLTAYVAKHARSDSGSGGGGGGANPDGAVVTLDKTSFADTVARGPVFVKFFVPWCGHCKKLAPTWTQFAARMKNRVAVAEVDCEAQPGVCTDQGVQGYPMIYLFQHGRKVEYTGRRAAEALEAFADAALAPPLKSISEAELSPLLETHPVLYLLVHDTLSPALRDHIEEAAQPLHGTPPIFSIHSSPALLEALSLPERQSLPILLALKDASPTPFHTLALPDVKVDVAKWFQHHAFPTSTELTAENFQRIMGPGPSSTSDSPPRLIVLAAVAPQNNAHIALMKELGTTWGRRSHADVTPPVVFAWMDKNKWASWLKNVYGVHKGTDTAIVVVDHTRLLYYDVSPTGAGIQPDAPSVLAALDGVLRGSIPPKHSENIAERFARWLNSWVLGTQSAITHHPIRTIVLLGVLLVAVFLGVKRLVESDTRKTALYTNHKSGARLD